MASGLKGKGHRRADTSRDPGAFVALPWAVLDCPAWQHLSHPARSLLMEIARQYNQGNNGRLLTSIAHLGPRGWRSADVLNRAKNELLKAGFIFETVKGHRPNRASWYAITWYSIDRHKDYDQGRFEAFKRSAYRVENEAFSPPRGAKHLHIAPRRGVAPHDAAP